MHHALMLARRGLGTVAPNPSVGCVIVKDGHVVGRGRTADGGRPHAETVALAQAGGDAKGATLYVSLEPCNHHGKTPPCADAVIAAGVKRAVIACRDAHAKAAGGAEKLKAAGVEVALGACEAEARALNEGFFSVVEKGRPFIAVKIAASLDGKITTGDPARRWLTGVRAREFGQWLRASHDAILTGIGTALADDPKLTCRLAGLKQRSSLRVVLDSRLRIPLSVKILATGNAHPKTLILTTSSAYKTHPNKIAALSGQGAEVVAVEEKDGRPDLASVVQLLAARGVTRLMVEAGAMLTTAFLRENLADRIYWFRAPVTVGEPGLAALVDETLLTGYTIGKVRRFGEDVLEVLERTGTF